MFNVVFCMTCVALWKHRKSVTSPVGIIFVFFGTPILEIVGFGIRIASLNMPNNNGLFLANNIFLGLGPLYLTAVNYIVFASLIVYTGQNYSVVRAKTILVTALIVMITCVHLQIRGSQPSCLANVGLVQAYLYWEDQTTQTVGSALMLGGLG